MSFLYFFIYLFIYFFKYALSFRKWQWNNGSGTINAPNTTVVSIETSNALFGGVIFSYETLLDLTGSMASKKLTVTVFLFLSLYTVAVFADGEEAEEVAEEEIKKAEYAKGSLCGYCDYCKVSNDALTVL